MRSPLCCVLLLAALAACGSPPATTPSRVPSRMIVLGLDGMDPDVVDRLMGEGKLPHFSKLRKEGAYAPLGVDPPLLSPLIWTSVATGKRPEEHGIGHFTATTAEGKEIPITSTLRRVKALWGIASAADRSVGVVGWWATWPAEAVRGVMVSDHTCYHFLKDRPGTRDLSEPGLIFPPEAVAEVEPLVRRPEDVTPAEAARFVDVSPAELARPFDFADDLSHFKWVLATTFSYRDIGLALWKKRQPDLLLVYLEGTDSTAHLFGHLFRQQGLAGELAEQQRKYGRAVEAMYELADEIVGDYLAVMDERTTLVVLSDHGFQLGELPTDPSKLHDMRRVSERFHRDHGILYLYGHGIRPGTALAAPRILDLAPTLLALASLPAATDMPGRVLDEAFVGLAVPARRATYEDGSGGAKPASLASDGTVDAAVLDKLKALGYIGDAHSASSDRNLAFLLLQDRRYEEAAAAFELLLGQGKQAAPDAGKTGAKSPDAGLVTGYASALAGLGKDGLAFRYFAAAIAADPVFAPAYHNRGVLHERLGQRDEAIADYRAAVRYDSDYEPARRALERLGAAAAPEARTVEEEQAAGLLTQATAARKRGDYAQASELLAAAERLAPAAPVYQEMSNVAFLMGDRQRAAEALRKALALDPENALLRHNLERLERSAAGRQR